MFESIISEWGGWVVSIAGVYVHLCKFSLLKRGLSRREMLRYVVLRQSVLLEGWFDV